MPYRTAPTQMSGGAEPLPLTSMTGAIVLSKKVGYAMRAERQDHGAAGKRGGAARRRPVTAVHREGSLQGSTLADSELCDMANTMIEVEPYLFDLNGHTTRVDKGYRKR